MGASADGPGWSMAVGLSHRSMGCKVCRNKARCIERTGMLILGINRMQPAKVMSPDVWDYYIIMYENGEID